MKRIFRYLKGTADVGLIYGSNSDCCFTVMQSYPLRVLDKKLQEDWSKVAKEGPGVLMNLRVDFLSPWAKVGSTYLCKY